MQRLKTRAQFQAALAGGTVARTPHFALHRCELSAAPVLPDGARASKAARATTPLTSTTSATADVAVSEVPKAEKAEQAEKARSAAPLFNIDAVWIGAMVPKRWARRAVTRNAIKRQSYQISAGCEAGFMQAAHVVRLRAGFDRKQFVSASSDALKAAVRAELDQLFARAARDVRPSSSKVVP